MANDLRCLPQVAIRLSDENTLFIVTPLWSVRERVGPLIEKTSCGGLDSDIASDFAHRKVEYTSEGDAFIFLRPFEQSGDKVEYRVREYRILDKHWFLVFYDLQADLLDEIDDIDQDQLVPRITRHRLNRAMSW